MMKNFKTTRGLVTLALGLLMSGAAQAAVPMQIPLQGTLRDNAGAPVTEGTFEMTFTLYRDADGTDSAWTTTRTVEVQGGMFRSMLGEETPVDAQLFSSEGGLWLGVAVEAEPELPLRPLASTPYALAAGDAAGLSCSGCVAPEALSPEALQTIREEAVAAGAAAGFATSAGELPFDDETANLGATDVQGALDTLQAMAADNAQAIAAGGGDAVEGQGTVRNYVNQWDINGFGSATEYVHVLKPSPPKVLMYLYADVSQNFSTGSNLQVAYDFAPNQYSSNIAGQAGEDVLQVGDAGVFNPGDHILLYQTVGTGGNGTGAGTWELNRVKSVEGGTVSLVKPLDNTYVSGGGSNGEAQAVVAASYNNLEIMSGGTVKPSQSLSSDGERGGIVYVRAQSLKIRNGGAIVADGSGYYNNAQGGNSHEIGDSECSASGTPYNCQTGGNCSAGGACGYNDCECGGGGGGNKTAGQISSSSGCTSSYRGQGGSSKGEDSVETLTMGGPGGYGGCWNYGHMKGGIGGGLVVLGASSIEVDSGGIIRSAGANGGERSGGGAGGTVALFTDVLVNEGTISAPGGSKGCSGSYCGGDGGEGWVHTSDTIQGIVNESFPKGMEIWVDGQNVTALVGDPNGKGAPTWDAEAAQWGADGLEPWSTGVLDLTNVADWTLGEHTVTIKETGGAGGQIKAYIYVVHTYSKSEPPLNNSCETPLALDVTTEPLVVSGTTEDLMGKTLATDAHEADGCGGAGGPDVTYRIDLEERSLINVAAVAPFPVRMYLREGDCATGEVVYCAEGDFSTTPLEPGTYFLVVDSDDPGAKGNFSLALSRTPAVLPINDTCDETIDLIFSASGIATHTGSTLYSLDQYSAFCGGDGGPDVVYAFEVGTGEGVDISVTSGDFEPVIHLYKGGCAVPDNLITCKSDGQVNIAAGLGGDYWLVVDSPGEAEWGEYNLTVTKSL
ncbi:MAG: hypothetical protein ACPGU1_11535 [Myxococcota bacterium]